MPGSHSAAQAHPRVNTYRGPAIGQAGQETLWRVLHIHNPHVSPQSLCWAFLGTVLDLPMVTIALSHLGILVPKPP